MITRLRRQRRRVRALPWATDARSWPLLRAPRRPDMARARLRRLEPEPWWLYLVLWALAALFAGLTLLDGVRPHEEGLVLQAAERVASGELPYRDFWTHHGPGQSLLLGGIAKLLGPSLVAWRVVHVALAATVALLAFVLARRRVLRPWALAAWAGAAGAMAFPALPAPTAAALALGLGAVALSARAPAWAGSLAGLAALFRPELGAAAAVGAALGAEREDALRLLGVAAVSAVALYAPFVLAAPADFAEQVPGFLGLQPLQRLPFPLGYDGAADPAAVLEFYGPLILLVGLAAWLAATLAQRAPLEDWALAPLALAGALSLLARTDELHLAPLAVVLPAMLAVRAPRARERWGRAALVVLLGLVVLQAVERQVARIVDPAGDRALALPAADDVRVPEAQAAALEATARTVDARVPPGRPVYVANARHDVVRVGYPLLYVLLERPNPTRYDVMQPGVTDDAAVQREIVADLRRARPGAVVRWLDPAAVRREPANDRVGTRLLDAHLATAYRPVARHGPFEVLVPRGSDAAGGG